MTAEEKKAYNNGFILGMASKGVIKVKGKTSDKTLSYKKPVSAFTKIDGYRSYDLEYTPIEEE